MGYGTLNAIIGLVLSVISYGLINAIISRHAIATDLSVAQFSQVLFGRTGAALATLIFSATAILRSSLFAPQTGEHRRPIAVTRLIQKLRSSTSETDEVAPLGGFSFVDPYWPSSEAPECPLWVVADD